MGFAEFANYNPATGMWNTPKSNGAFGTVPAAIPNVQAATGTANLVGNASSYVPTMLGNATTYNPAMLGRPSTYTANLVGSPNSITAANPYADLAALYPDLAGANQSSASIIADQMAGRLSPSMLASIKNAGAAWGLGTTGVPGTGLGRTHDLLSVGKTAEALQQQGLSNYNSILPMIASTQTVSPALQAQIAQFNASNQNQFSLANQAAQNQGAQFNIGNQMQYGLANQAAQNQAGQYNAGMENQFSLANQAAQNSAGQFNTGSANQFALSNQNAQNQMALANMSAQNAANQFNSTIADRNALYAAAPDPAAAASYSEGLYNRYLQNMSGGYGQMSGLNNMGGYASRPFTPKYGSSFGSSRSMGNPYTVSTIGSGTPWYNPDPYANMNYGNGYQGDFIMPDSSYVYA